MTHQRLAVVSEPLVRVATGRLQPLQLELDALGVRGVKLGVLAVKRGVVAQLRALAAGMPAKLLRL